MSLLKLAQICLFNISKVSWVLKPLWLLLGQVAKITPQKWDIELTNVSKSKHLYLKFK
jgi:hypothetical protein